MKPYTESNWVKSAVILEIMTANILFIFLARTKKNLFPSFRIYKFSYDQGTQIIARSEKRSKNRILFMTENFIAFHPKFWSVFLYDEQLSELRTVG